MFRIEFYRLFTPDKVLIGIKFENKFSCKDLQIFTFSHDRGTENWLTDIFDIYA